MYNFDEVWDRVKKETDIKKLRQLAEVVESTQQNISNRKKAKSFPVTWAYQISKKSNLNIEWILEGTGPIRPDQPNREIEIINQIEKWVTETEKKEPGALSWFKFDFRKKYPEFDKWEKREEGNSSRNISAG